MVCVDASIIIASLAAVCLAEAYSLPAERVAAAYRRLAPAHVHACAPKCPLPSVRSLPPRYPLTGPVCTAEGQTKKRAQTTAAIIKKSLLSAVVIGILCSGSLAGAMTAPHIGEVEAREARDSGMFQIKNRVDRYGNYCGPGPAEVNPSQGCQVIQGLPPADFIDEKCLLHDKAYCNCRKELESRGKIFLPGFFQLISVRGELPRGLAKPIVQMDDTFSACIHSADLALVARFDRIEMDSEYPIWWSHTALAPPGAEGAEYAEACAFGLAGKCLLSSKVLFSRLGLVFKKGLLLDAILGVH